MTQATITNEAIADAADACWQVCPNLKAALQANSNSFVLIKSGQIAEAIGHLQLTLDAEGHKRLRRTFRRELAKRA